jgi:hypothetical protein
MAKIEERYGTLLQEFPRQIYTRKKLRYVLTRIIAAKIEERHGLFLQGFPRQKEERYGKITLWLLQQNEKKDTVQLDNDACCK